MFRFLTEANERSELVTIFYFKYVIPIYFIGGVVIFIANIVLVYFKHHELKAEYFNATYQIVYGIPNIIVYNNIV